MTAMAPPQSMTDGRVPWADHLAGLRWDQGDHVTLIGPTKSGKTTLARAILPERRHVLVLACKPRSPSMQAFVREDGYRVVRKWGDVQPRHRGDRVILWPGLGRSGRIIDPDDFEQQQLDQFRACLNDVYMTGGWTVYVDELSYISEYLGLDRELNRLWLQGREVPLTLVVAMQSPAYVPRYAYDQIQHVYIWRNRDLRRIKTLAELSGAMDRDALEAGLSSLGEHEVLYVDPTGRAERTKVDV